MNLKGLMTRVKRSDGGFTLIELLVVVAILGIIAAVVVLNIGSFIGSGAEQAANTEAHQVQTAVIAYMTANSDTSYAGPDVGPGETTGPVEYLLNPGTLQAVYTIATDGSIASGDATAVSNSKWGDLTYTPGTGWA